MVRVSVEMVLPTICAVIPNAVRSLELMWVLLNEMWGKETNEFHGTSFVFEREISHLKEEQKAL